MECKQCIKIPGVCKEMLLWAHVAEFRGALGRKFLLQYFTQGVKMYGAYRVLNISNTFSLSLNCRVFIQL
jgi:hypothetical protein